MYIKNNEKFSIGMIVEKETAFEILRILWLYKIIPMLDEKYIKMYNKFRDIIN